MGGVSEMELDVRQSGSDGWDWTNGVEKIHKLGQTDGWGQTDKVKQIRSD